MDSAPLKPPYSKFDIGSGFGGLAMSIAEKTGARVDGITLSKVQLEFSQLESRKKKLDNLCQFKIQDYRDVKKKYSKINFLFSKSIFSP